MKYHPTTEKIVEIIMRRVNNPNPTFFRITLAFYYGIMASQMRAMLTGYRPNEELPINTYAINLAPSGSGKNLSSNFITEHLMGLFNNTYQETFRNLAHTNIEALAITRSTRTGESIDDAYEELGKQFMSLGTPVSTFDNATVPAIKQLRQKFLMANCGSLNLLVDECGANLLKTTDALHSYLELYDRGFTKFSLTKNSSDNLRGEILDGCTPSNMLLFGTPSKLLDGANVEASFMELLNMGYARRCLFGYSTEAIKPSDKTPQEILAEMRDTRSTSFLDAIADNFEKLAKPSNAHKKIHLSDEVLLQNVTYMMDNQNKAYKLEKSNPLLATEMAHRHFKALKLAGVYAFIDGATEVSTDHMEYAITLVEDSAEHFTRLIQVDRPYVKLAKYLANQGSELSLADLDTSLPYFRGTKFQKDELISMATAYGYKNNIVITKSIQNGVVFIKGETLEETDLNQLIASASYHITENYENSYIAWDDIDDLAKSADIHWCTHHLRDGYRNEERAIPGFNLLVLDVDDGTTVEAVKEILGDIKYLIYTTKRHTETTHRFRVVIPMNYTLKLDKKQYKEFCKNIYETLPFPMDEQTNQRSRKWLTNDGETYINDGELFDVLPYIPNSTKNDERTKKLKELGDLAAMEKWFLQNLEEGNRNNLLLRYGLVLLSTTNQLNDVRYKILELNSYIPDSLSEDEIDSTIMRTLARRLEEVV